MDDERDALEAIYQDEFEILGDGTWRIGLPEHDCKVKIKLDPTYPDGAAPIPALEFDPWPVHGDALARQMEMELPKLWQPGETCIYQWVEHLREALTSAVEAPPEVTSKEVEAEVKVSAIPLSPETSLGPSLLAAGFTQWSPQLFAESDRGVTVELSEVLSITVDGVDTEDLMDWASMQLTADPGNFGARLLEWVTAQRSPEPGFLEDEEEGTKGPDFLPSPEELGVRRDRLLLVYTWGKALRKAAPGDSEHNFNAGILNGRGGGADLKSMNGLWDEVQSNVASCGLFPRWISMVCAKVEHSDLRCISINCTKGRHRSVAAAEILKKTYYPNATVKHLTIY
eukprot:Skav222457  [mRNA]  locus=scaffold3319:151576:152598:+ [translate_table: standard]